MFETDTDLSNEAIERQIQTSLPSVLSQLPDSNNQKLLHIISDLACLGKDNLLSVYKCKQLKYSSNACLDLIAEEYNIKRIDDDDEFLRFMVRTKIMQNTYGSTTNELKKMISIVMELPIDQFDFEATANPEELVITNIPFDFISGAKTEVKRKLVVEAIQDMLPPEYLLADVRYSKSTYLNVIYALSSSRNKLNNGLPSYEYSHKQAINATTKFISNKNKFKE
ncbi:hypothetical protein FC87_GL000740 [Fructilactobacillus florum DSM 22689 = JCM 16035]|uniref:Uncharacterized protein n=2 Tax=Fructilactobacillus florum TaxID=640331 RepID=A0A0R2CJ21_9LACO|nr:hypothetical protein [Fructilactobacillus florum]KRM91608.1 hypothetical protein FC87_GL000740 [Fructilactobacillus florum DSM 22689 = JCM 16035]